MISAVRFGWIAASHQNHQIICTRTFRSQMNNVSSGLCPAHAWPMPYSGNNGLRGSFALHSFDRRQGRALLRFGDFDTQPKQRHVLFFKCHLLCSFLHSRHSHDVRLSGFEYSLTFLSKPQRSHNPSTAFLTMHSSVTICTPTQRL